MVAGVPDVILTLHHQTHSGRGFPSEEEGGILFLRVVQTWPRGRSAKTSWRRWGLNHSGRKACEKSWGFFF